ncbi:RNase A-like domain-containing protein [Streptomyces sp. NRRL S-340]|uniref:RNase A-like domain-containing protein n=1 Tax=Streptomyces sp. NRRL S-340 TaxID=1463901 RepID=UPI000A89C2CB|nr:RNase A-like domain-containing protein [Streptomyces sp. NRRL S-340]
MGTPVPGQNGVIDVKPTDLHRVSCGVASQQTVMDKGARTLLDDLRRYPDAGGYGTSPQAFATSYVKVGNRFLEVWAKSVVSIGGAAVGFTSTANAYAKAEAANDPTGQAKPVVQPLPKVIDKAPAYGSVPNLKWGDDDGGDDFVRRLLEWVPGPVRDLLRPVVKHAFRMGKVADVYPFPQQHYLNSLSQAWMATTVPLSTAESGLSGNVSSITQQTNSEWYDAMRQFCSSLWGTTAWGGNRENYAWKHDSSASQTATHPAMTVLFDTARKVGDLLYDFAEAAVYVNGEVWDVYVEAVRDAIPKVEVNLKDGVGMDDVKGLVKGLAKGVAKGAVQLSEGIVLNMDTARLNAIVTEYNRRVDTLVPQLDALMGPLDEAYLSAPAYEAQEARAEGFGMRSLEEFKDSQVWLKVDSAGNYDLNLAANEYLENGHTLDKHVGKTDEQLAQRLRDQQTNGPTQAWPHGKPYPGAASSFPSYQRAEELTEYNLNQNKAAIEAWIKGPPPPTDGKVEKFLSTAPHGEISGRSVFKQPVDPNDPLSGYKEGGINAKAYDVTGIDTRIRYDSSRNPPFTVMTSMPYKP